jgi:hypothetical protein
VPPLRGKFHPRRNTVDALLPALFISVHFVLGDRWWIALVFLLAWMGLSAYLGKNQGPIHVFVAGLVVATLWFLAVVARGLVPRDLPSDVLPWIYCAAAFLGLGFASLCLVLDRILTGELVEDERWTGANQDGVRSMREGQLAAHASPTGRAAFAVPTMASRTTSTSGSIWSRGT